MFIPVQINKTVVEKWDLTISLKINQQCIKLTRQETSSQPRTADREFANGAIGISTNQQFVCTRSKVGIKKRAKFKLAG